MNILVTGGAGYLGSTIVPYLMRPDDTVTVLDTFRHGMASLAQSVGLKNLEVVAGDARDPRVLAPLVAKADVVIPLAAIVGAPACAKDHLLTASTNYEAIQLLASLLSTDQRVVFPNTNSGYGTADDICTEATPLNPLSAYARTKADAESLLLNRPNSISLRLATVFGASPRHRLDLLVNDFVFRATQDKAVVLFEPYFKRNFVHIRDVARGFIHALDNFEQMKNDVFNLGDTRANMNKVNLCGAIRKRVPEFDWFIGRGSDPDKRNYTVSNAKIEATGWAPAYSLDDGIAELLKLYRGFVPAAGHSNV